jgi:hypothetical protein
VARSDVIPRVIAYAQGLANTPKAQLMNLITHLEANHAKRKADALRRVVARLERWQNTP